MTLEKKVIDGKVRLTLSKYIHIAEYIMALVSPQWNMPTGSKFDYDTLAPAVTNHIIINEGDYNYRDLPAY